MVQVVILILTTNDAEETPVRVNIDNVLLYHDLALALVASNPIVTTRIQHEDGSLWVKEPADVIDAGIDYAVSNNIPVYDARYRR